MAGQTIVIDCVRGDEVVVYAYTGTWLADFPMNHYTHWVGLLLKPSQEEVGQAFYFGKCLIRRYSHSKSCILHY